MKRLIRCAWLVSACLLGAGCLVRSIQPWLSDESRVKDPSLIGSWHDAKSQSVAFFSESSSSDYDYNILWVQNGKDLSRFTASLHRIDDVLLLVVGPDDPENMNGCVLLPGHLLLKTTLEGDSLKFFGLDLESFEDRAAKAAIGLLPDGSISDGYTLAGATAEVEAFARAQLADPEFFDAEPLYAFRKLPGAAD
jgi:hypothetical protein